MAQTAAQLVDNVFPPLPVRQWGLSVSKRLRYFLERAPVDAAPDWDTLAQPEPAYAFDQRVPW